MTDDDVRELLRRTRTIAVVGLSTDPAKASYGVSRYMKERGYRVIPVNPGAQEILGEKAYPNLTAIPEPVDIVDIFRPSPAVPPIVEEAIRIGAKAVWMQEGISHAEAAQRAEAAGLAVVQDRCIMKEHFRLLAR
ncbi:MAG TPA: CoA-binding protein [Anaerolineales bacterium]|nr:CoA-binding protein [Anaerolineales bacterium]